MLVALRSTIKVGVLCVSNWHHRRVQFEKMSGERVLLGQRVFVFIVFVLSMNGHGSTCGK